MWSTELPERCLDPSESSPDSGAAEGGHLSVSQRAALALLWTYKTAISPLLMSCCKFHPTCSAYAREAIEIHGVARGMRLTAGRLLRCRPFAPGGFDPVPEKLGPADV